MCMHITNAVIMSENKARYDTSVKEVLADKQVLARILKYTLDEFKDDSIEEIIRCISDDIAISSIQVDPGLTNLGKVAKSSEEDTVPGEGTVVYDIRFSVIRREVITKLLINIEAQKSTDYSKLGYHIDNRIVYYLGRMISAQKSVEFDNSDYDNIKPVRSIWICMDARDDEDSVNRIEFKQNTLYGKDVEVPGIDKAQATIIRLRKNPDARESRNKLIAMLETLLGNQDAKSKCERLEKQYGFIINDETARRVNTMCNLSDVVEERGIERGLARGIEQGIEQGMKRGLAQGIEQGREQTLEQTVRRLLIKNYPDGEIIDITECTPELLERVKAEMKDNSNQ